MRLASGLFLASVSLACGLSARPATAASFAVTYSDSAGEGFFDPSLGQARRTAFEASLSYWSSHLGASPTVINISASFDPLGGTANSATLGQAGPSAFSKDFSSTNSQFKSGTYYASSLANHLAGRDLDTATPEIVAQFNSDVDGPTVLGSNSFYYGLDSNPPNGDSDFYTVCLHEVGHGLNFLSLITQSGAYSIPSFPGIYDTFLTLGNSASRTRLTAMTDTQRGSAIISNNLYFDGPLAQSGNGGTPARIYAPTTYEPGSSVSHLDEATYPGLNANNLITPVYSGPYHDAGPVMLGVLADEGWAIGSSPQVSSIRRTDFNPTGSRVVHFAVNFNTPVTGVDSSDFSLTTTGNVTGATISNVAGSGATYTVTVANYSGTAGTIRLNVVDDDSINDSGNPLGGTGVGNGNYSSGEVYNITTPTSSTVASVYIVNAGNTGVFRVDPPSTVQNAFANLPSTGSNGVARGSDGTLYVAGSNTSSLLKITTTGTVSALTSGNLLSSPYDVVIGPDAMLYVSSKGNNSIVKIDPTSGAQSLVSSDGGAQGSLINTPEGLDFGSDGLLYVGNTGNHNILTVDSTTGVQSIYASLDQGTQFLTNPTGIAFGPDSSLYVEDGSNNRIIRVARGAGTGSGSQSVVAAEGTVSSPRGLAFGRDGNLYVADGGNNRVVSVVPATGAQTVISSGGSLGTPGDVALVYTSTPTNTAPTINSVDLTSAPQFTATFSSVAPKTNDTVKATVGATDAEGDSLTYTYVWKNGATTVKTTTTTSATDTLDLSIVGNGDKGNTIAVSVTASDGSLTSNTRGATSVVTNSPPVITSTLAIPTWLGRQIINRPDGVSDPDGDTLTFSSNTTGLANGTLNAVDSTDGLFLFTPSATGTSNFGIVVTDSSSASATCAVTVTTTSTPAVGTKIYTAIGASDANAFGATAFANGYTAKTLVSLNGLPGGDTYVLSNRGVNGFTTKDLTRTVGGKSVLDLVTADHPDVYTLWIGPNDVVAVTLAIVGQPSATQDAIISNFLSGWKTDFDTVISRVTAANPSAKRAVADIPPLGTLLYAAKPVIGTSTRDKLDQLCANMSSYIVGKGIPTVDLLTNADLNGDPTNALTPADIYIDGYHPNDSGYAKIANRFWALLRPQFNFAPSISTTTLSNGNQNTFYGPVQLVATDPDGDTLTWSVPPGSLPDGLSLSTAGVLSGTPTGSGTSTFTVTVDDGKGHTASKTLSLTISLTLSVSNVSVFEGNSGSNPANFTVNLSSASAQSVSVSYATSNGTATAGSDYTAANSTLTIPAGQTSATIPVAVLGDLILEPDETFSLTLSSPSGASFAGNVSSISATGTIKNDDNAPLLTLTGVSKAEGQSGTTAFVFKVDLSAPSASAVTVNYATANGTATAGSDYTATNSTLTIPAGSTSGTITVNVNGDTTVEPDETFTLTLSSPTGGAVFQSGASSISATGTIVNDDADVTPVASNVTGQIQVFKSGLSRNKKTGRYVMSLIVQNTGADLNGPLYLTFDGLLPGVDLYSPDGYTSRATPLGSPYRTLVLPGVDATHPNGVLASGTSLSLTVEFVNPNNAGLDFTNRVLQGPGIP